MKNTKLFILNSILAFFALMFLFSKDTNIFALTKTQSMYNTSHSYTFQYTRSVYDTTNYITQVYIHSPHLL